MVVARIKRAEPHSVAVSARTGEGIAEAIAAIEADLPRPRVEFTAIVPYARGDLIDRIHKDGEISALEHTAVGTREPGIEEVGERGVRAVSHSVARRGIKKNT